MEEYSEGKIHESEPELWNGNVKLLSTFIPYSGWRSFTMNRGVVSFPRSFGEGLADITE